MKALDHLISHEGLALVYVPLPPETIILESHNWVELFPIHLQKQYHSISSYNLGIISSASSPTLDHQLDMKLSFTDINGLFLGVKALRGPGHYSLMIMLDIKSKYIISFHGIRILMQDDQQKQHSLSLIDAFDFRNIMLREPLKQISYEVHHLDSGQPSFIIHTPSKLFHIKSVVSSKCAVFRD